MDYDRFFRRELDTLRQGAGLTHEIAQVAQPGLA